MSVRGRGWGVAWRGEMAGDQLNRMMQGEGPGLWRERSMVRSMLDWRCFAGGFKAEWGW